MKKTKIDSLYQAVGEKVRVSGWVDKIRDQKKMQFIILRGEGGKVQVVNEKSGKNLDEIVSSLSPEATIDAYGEVVYNEGVSLGKIEIKLEDIEVTSRPIGPLPIDGNSSLDHRLDWRFIDLRTLRNRLIFEVQTTIEHAMRSYFMEKRFIEMHSPKLMEGASECGSELFQLDYFGKKASLAQSPQFYKQMAMAAGFNRVFEIGPVFRANPSFTSRHDTEFTSIDVEMSWIDSHEDVMEFEERWVQYVMSQVKGKHGGEIYELFGSEVTVPDVPFPRITMEDAQEILEKRMKYDNPKKDKGDLDPEGERLVYKFFKEECNHDFVFVKDYPVCARPFYHMRSDSNPDITKSFDLIWKGLEVTTGAQREHRYDRLKSQIEEKGQNPNDLGHYLNFFKYGCPPHGGYGFGLTRMLMNLLDLNNVKEVTYLYGDLIV